MMVRNGALRVKLQLYSGGLHSLGPGKVELLAAIDREGSVAAAGRTMGMDYGKCRMLVERMNQIWISPLVESRANGGPQRGARLTDLGREVVAGFHALETCMNAVVATDERAAFLLKAVRPEPLPGPRAIED